MVLLLDEYGQYVPIQLLGEAVPETEYVTDAGLVVPAVSGQLRERLHAALDSHGLGMSKQSELVGRSFLTLHRKCLNCNKKFFLEPPGNLKC